MEDTANVTQTDVPVVEETTPASSNGEQTAQPEQGGTTEPKAEKGSEVPDTNRFAERARKAEKEVERLSTELKERDKKAQAEANPSQEALKAELDPILKDMGYVSKQELQEQQQEEKLNAELTRLEGTYDGKDGRPKFDREVVVQHGLETGIYDPEAAYQHLHNQALIDWHVKQAMTKAQGVESESSNGSGSNEVGTTNDDLKKEIAGGNKGALRTYLKRLAPKS